MNMNKQYDVIQILKLAIDKVTHYENRLKELYQFSINYDRDCLFEIFKLNIFKNTFVLQSVSSDLETIIREIHDLNISLEEEAKYLISTNQNSDNLQRIRKEIVNSVISEMKDYKKRVDCSSKLIKVNELFDLDFKIEINHKKAIRDYYQNELREKGDNFILELQEFCGEMEDDFKYDGLYTLAILNKVNKDIRR